MKLLKGKWALVTGSSRGIGQQIATGLAERNCNIVVHGRRPENTASTVELLKSYDTKCMSSVESCRARKVSSR
jgi:short-subunit dehydrogenase